MRIIVRNYRTTQGEVDLVARDGDTVVFVEVKTRRRGEPAEAVTAEKQRRLTLAAMHFLKRHRLLEHSARFDVITVIWPESGRAPVDRALPGRLPARRPRSDVPLMHTLGNRVALQRRPPPSARPRPKPLRPSDTSTKSEIFRRIGKLRKPRNVPGPVPRKTGIGLAIDGRRRPGAGRPSGTAESPPRPEPARDGPTKEEVTSMKANWLRMMGLMGLGALGLGLARPRRRPRRRARADRQPVRPSGHRPDALQNRR